MKKLLLLTAIGLFIITMQACRQTEEEDWRKDFAQAETSEILKNDISVCYNAFPISYADSNNDGYGDLRGIAENIDYLADTLGVDCLWLNPIHPSPTYHKYDVLDYYDIDPQFGTMEDFEYLIQVATDHNIVIVMDLVINHTAYNHPWFINSRLGEDSEYRNWYSWNDLSDQSAFPRRQNWHRHGDSYYYGSFWSQMPELNYDEVAVRAEMKNIFDFWLDKGVLGFRIDAARHIYDRDQYPIGTDVNAYNIQLFMELNDHINTRNPNAFMIGEIWSNDPNYVGAFFQGMDATFNFELADKTMDAIRLGTDPGIAEMLSTMLEVYGEYRTDFVDNVFLTNHDKNRVADTLGYSEGRMRLAAHMLFTYPGVSWIYYGEELGMSGSKPDPSIRQPFKWSMDSAYNTEGKPNGIHEWNARNQSLLGVYEQLLDETSLLNLYIELIALKQNDVVLRHGDFEAFDTQSNRLVGFFRSYGDTTYLVIHNLSANSQTMQHDLTIDSIVYQSHQNTVNSGTIEVLPFSSMVVKINE